MNTLVLSQMLSLRRRSILWWSVAMALLAWVIAVTYLSVADSADVFDQYLESLPEGVVDVLGTSSLTSPEGYLTSQFYGNMFPLLLIILGVGAAAWAVAGSETEGTFEMLLANPVSRTAAALSRWIAVIVIVVIVGAVATATIALTKGLYEMGQIPLWHVLAAGVGVIMLALVFTAIAFAVGAATGSRGAAIGAGAGAAAGTYVLFGIAAFVEALHDAKWVSPWFWLLDTDPLSNGTDADFWLRAVLLPLAVIVVALLAGLWRLNRRDVR